MSFGLFLKFLGIGGQLVVVVHGGHAAGAVGVDHILQPLDKAHPRAVLRQHLDKLSLQKGLQVSDVARNRPDSRLPPQRISSQGNTIEAH